MKLLLIAAAMVGSAYGACSTATVGQLASAGVTGGAAGTGSGTDKIATGDTATCLAGYSGSGTATCGTVADAAVTWAGCTACTDQTGCTTAGNTANTCSTATTILTKKQCTEAATGYWLSGTTTARIATACDCGTNGLTCTCNAADGTAMLVLSCDAGFAFTDIVAEIPAVTATSGANGGTGVVTALPAIAGDAKACPEVAVQALRAAVPLSALVALVPASCAATACSGEQAGCVTGTATNTVNTCSTAGSLRCTQSKRGFSLVSSSGETTACAKTNVATYKAPAADASGTCEAATCNAGWTISGTAPNQVCSTANVCTAGAVKAGYAATGITARAAADAITRVCTSETTCAATPPTGTCTAGVDIVNIRAAVAASAATDVDGLGTVTCAEGFTGTAVAACPTADGAFTYTGCAAAAAPASVAQTIVAFVLTVVAMYL